MFKLYKNFLPRFESCISSFWSLSETLNWILRAKEDSLKPLKCQIRLTNPKSFFWKSETNIELSENLLPIFEFSSNLSWSLSKAWIKCYEIQNIGSRLSNAKFGWRIQIYFLLEKQANVEILEKLSPCIWPF